MSADNQIAPEIIADWQQRCCEDPTGEALIDHIDLTELLRVYQAWQDGLQLEASRYAPATQ